MNNLDKFINKFVHLVEDVPFGNSNYQNRNAIVNDELTPARAYRHAALRIMNRLQSLREAKFSLQENDINIREAKAKIRYSINEFEKERLELQIERLESTLPYTRKLIKDAIVEIQSLLPIIESIGKLSREDFELQEPTHFKNRPGVNWSGKSNDLYAYITTVDKKLPLDIQGLIEDANNSDS